VVDVSIEIPSRVLVHAPLQLQVFAAIEDSDKFLEGDKSRIQLIPICQMIIHQPSIARAVNATEDKKVGERGEL
jgi:hypothetical protein